MRVLVAVVTAVLVMWAAAPPAAAGDEWVWPLDGRVLTVYSNDNARPYEGGMHRGIDIAADAGAGVVAARAGTVTHAGVVGSAGLVVAVRTADGRYVTSYLHLSDVTVRKGEEVTAGTRVGAVGTSGRRSVPEPHLHFGVRLAQPPDHYVDPLSLLPAAVAQPAAAPPPAPVPAPVRTAPQAVPAPVAVRALAVRDARRFRVPARTRPRGTIQPGPAVVPRPVAAPDAQRQARVPAGPAQAPAPRRAHLPVPVHGSPRELAAPAPAGGAGRALVGAGVGVLALLLFGGASWRALTRMHRQVNAGAATATGLLRDRVRTAAPLRRILPR